MDNVETIEPSDTEVVAEREAPEALSIRDALSKNFNKEDDAVVSEATEHNNPEETEAAPEAETQTVEATATQEQPPVERIPLVPPADMNKAEKEAFLNPTAENAHVLQQYMNRRAYETRSDYQRRVEEVENLRKQTSSFYDSIKQHEDYYAKQGISISDVARRSVAWDRAMQANPVQTALEWLESYGLNPNDLVANAQEGQLQQAQPANYLTREEAERIAEEKFKTYQDQQQQNAVAYYNERVVESFMNNKPLFRDRETASQLEAEMAPIVTALTSTGKYSSPEEILETAYNYVVNGNPTFSSLHNAMTAKPIVEQKAVAVQKAKAASRTITGSPGSGNPRVVAKDLRDNLRRRFGGE